MTKITIALLVLAVLALYIGGTTVKLNPFSFKIARPLSSVGIVLLVFGYTSLAVSERRAGKDEGYYEAIDVLRDELSKKQTVESAIEAADSVK